MSTMGVGAPLDHAKTSRHLSQVAAAKKPKAFFTKAKPQPKPSVVTDKCVPSSPTSGQSSSVTPVVLTVAGDEVLRAKLLWALKTIQSSYSARAASVGHLFGAMFPDSDIAAKFSMQKDSIIYLINYGIAPYLRKNLVDDINKSLFHSLSFDESLNDSMQQSQMDIVVRYWDESASRVKARYFHSDFLGHATAKDLLSHFQDATQDLDDSRLVQIGMDGPSVNHLFFKLLVDSRRKKEQNDLVTIGSCNIHNMHGAYRNGIEASGWEIKNTLKGAYQTFKDSPARRDDYITQTGCDKFPFSFPGTRWLENLPVANRFIALYSYLQIMVRYYENQPPSKRPKSKSYCRLRDGIKDILITAKMEFTCFVSSKFQFFLTFYQTDAPVLPLMHEHIMDIVKSLAGDIMNTSDFKKLNTLVDLKKLDLCLKSKSLRPTGKIEIGCAATLSISKLLRKDAINDDQVGKFRSGCMTFVIKTILKIKEYTSPYAARLRNFSCLDPTVMESNPTIAESRFSAMVQYFISTGHIKAALGDLSKKEYKTVLALPCLKLFKSENNERLDDFFFKTIGCGLKYKNLSVVLKLVFVMSHGQGKVERGFNVNEHHSATNISAKTLVSRRMVSDFLTTEKICLESYVISKELLRYGRNASSQRRLELQKKSAKKNADPVAEQKKKVADDICHLKERKKLLEEEIAILRQKSDKMVEEGAKKSSMVLVQAGVAITQQIPAKEKEIVEVVASIADKQKELASFKN